MAHAPLVSILQRTVLAEVLSTFVVAFFGITGVILLVTTVVILRRSVGLELEDVLSVLPLFAAYLSVYTLPLTLLFAIVWCFARMREDGEIVALRAAGVHLHTVTVPVVLVAVGVSALALVLLDRVMPVAHLGKSQVMRTTAKSRLARLGAGGAEHVQLGGFEILLGGVTPEGKLPDLLIYQLSSDGQSRPEARLAARRGRAIFDDATGVLELVLEDGRFERLDETTATEMAFSALERTIPISAPDAEITRAVLASDQPPGVLDLGAVRLEIGGRDPASGDFTDVEATCAVTARAHRSARGRLALEADTLVVTLEHVASARTARSGMWGHAFTRQMAFELPPAEASAWRAFMAEAKRGDPLTLAPGQVDAEGVVHERVGASEILVRDLVVREEARRLSFHAARLALEVSPAERAGASASLHLAARDGSVAGWPGGGARPLAMEFEEGRFRLGLGGARTPQLAPADLTVDELYAAYILPPEARGSSKLTDDARIISEIHYRYALAFAPLLLSLMAIPLALVLATANRVVAFGVTLLKVFAVYFPLVLGARALGTSGALDAHLEWIPVLLWTGNGVVGIIGAFLFVRLHRV